MDKEWIGVDFDGTLAKYTSWKGADHAGEPIKKMVDRVKRWLKAGKDVRIFTARVTGPDKDVARKTINDFCQEQFGQKLKITATKDQHMTELWDDRAVEVEKNTGEVAESVVAALLEDGEFSPEEMSAESRGGFTVGQLVQVDVGNFGKHTGRITRFYMGQKGWRADVAVEGFPVSNAPLTRLSPVK